MSAEFPTENNESNEKGLSPLELGSALIVTAASAYITLAHIIPQTDAYIATKIVPELVGKITL